VTALVDGKLRVGLDGADESRLLSGEPRKTAARDLPIAIAQRWPLGATTVSAALALAEAAGIHVFATGGIGGVHRGVETSADVSADLDALAHSALVTVSAGPKAFLDLARTLEWLDSHSVPVVGWRTSEFPAFFSRSCGLPVPHRVEDAAEVAAIFDANAAVAPRRGVLVVAPIPEPDEIPWGEVSAAIDRANAEAAARGIAGSAVTPFVLAQLVDATEGRTIPANVALAEHNASVAGEVAVAVAARRAKDLGG
jgi:pseudouridine-5'-phosphate glycosidase